MATRLPADEGSKESKWADIDDDEDDWAPEPVQWLDGTKSTVTAVETRATATSPAPEIKKAEPPITQLPPPVSTTPKPALPPTKTILKPGTLVAPQQKSSGTVVLKGGSEKSSTPVSAVPAPPPAKSPWQQLPPVDKASPVTFAPPAPPPARVTREQNPFDLFPPASAMEIPPDDFNRMWDGESNRNKALFNSQSGQLETVNDNRRGGQPRAEQGHRQPAVLQRPGNQLGHAEPSAAFQTSRSSGQDPWQPRHRTGSVGSAGRRMSIGRAKDFTNERYEGTSPTLMTAQPHQGYADRGSVQAAPHQRSWSRTSPAMTSAQPIVNEQPEEAASVEGSVPLTPNAPVEDAAVVQQRLMREKIEKARQQKLRELEEERREEEARKERLRLKMEALVVATPSPTTEQQDAKREVQVSHGSSPQLAKPVALASPPKPPVPKSEGEVAQYGMMKVHQPHPVKRAPVSEKTLMGHVQNATNESPNQRLGPNSRLQNAHDGAKPASESRAGETAAGWRAPGLPETLSGWSTSNTSNLWAPPQSKDRALGNGTFETGGFNRITAPHAHGHTHTHTQQAHGQARAKPAVAAGAPSLNSISNINVPGPIAPPSSSAPSQPSQPFGRNPPHPSVPHSTDSNYAADHHHHHQDQSPSLDMAAAVQHSASPSITQPPAFQGQQNPRYSHADWAALPDKLAQQAKAESAQFMEQFRKVQAGTFTSKPNTSTFVETYTRTAPSSTLGGRPVPLSVEHRTLPPPGHKHDENSAIVNGAITPSSHPGSMAQPPYTPGRPSTINENISRLNGEKQSGAQAMTPAASQSSNVVPTHRASRFFPRTNAIESSDKSNSPPPPEISSLDTGFAMPSPKVHLPKIAVVKLPPPRPAEPNHVTLSPSAPASRQSNASAAPPTEWQRKFDNLLRQGKDNQATLKHAVDSASRSPLDISVSKYSTTVSLPISTRDDFRKRSYFAIDTSGNVQSRDIDEDLFPQPEFGSTPTIRFPRVPYTDLSNPSDYPTASYSTLRQLKEYEKEMASSKLYFDVSDIMEGAKNGSVTIVVRPIAGAQQRFLSMQVSRSNYRPYGNNYRGRRGNDMSRGSRKSSAPFSPREGQPSSTRNSNAPRSSNRGSRGNGGNYNGRRNVTAPPLSVATSQ
jgi:hypothetical protein